MRGLIRRAAVLAGAMAVLAGSGTGVAAAQQVPHLVINPNPGNFGTVQVGGTATRTFTLANTGGSASGNLTISVSASPPFTITGTTCRGALPPRQSCTVTVQFAPAKPATATATLTAAGTKPEARATATLHGSTPCRVRNTTRGRTDTSLQKAVRAAAAGDKLLVTGTCTGTTTIGKDLTIAGRNGATLNGEKHGSVLTITAGVMVTVSNLTITDGRAAALGGGINNSGTLTLNDGTAITGNGAPSQGGGINNSTGGTVILNDRATITGNTANNGGGIFNFGTVTLNGTSSIKHNAATSGGGIFNIGTVTLNDSATITGNTVSSRSGGGIFNLGTVKGNRGNVFGNRPNDIFPPFAPPSPPSAGRSSAWGSTPSRCSPGAPGLGFYNGKVCIGTTRLPDGRFAMIDPARPGLRCGPEPDGARFEPFTQRNNTWGNGKPANLKTACVDAMYAAATQWDMLRAWLGRNGFDGRGHAARIEVGWDKPKALFTPRPALVQIGFVCRRLGHFDVCIVPDPLHRQKSSMDIVGHEFGHMVFDTTPGGYHGDVPENGALAEGTGDIFAQLTIAFANNPGVPLTYTIGSQFGPPERIMYHPSLAGAGAPDCWSPDLTDLSFGEASGPLNHWFYLLAEGSNPVGLPPSPTCDRSTLTGLGIQLAGKIWYNALLLKTPTWRYRDARSATLAAAKQLFPGSCTVFDKVKAAWNGVSVPARPGEPTCTTRRT